MSVPLYIEAAQVIVPAPDMVQSAQCFHEHELISQVQILSSIFYDHGWDPRNVGKDAWFLGSYLSALVSECRRRISKNNVAGMTLAFCQAMDDAGERVENFRRAIPEGSRPYPDWFGNNLEVHRPHRKLLMLRNPQHYNECAIMDYRGILVAWIDEAQNPY